MERPKYGPIPVRERHAVDLEPGVRSEAFIRLCDTDPQMGRARTQKAAEDETPPQTRAAEWPMTSNRRRGSCKPGFRLVEPGRSRGRFSRPFSPEVKLDPTPACDRFEAREPQPNVNQRSPSECACERQLVTE
jgi:hypothetical protein